MTVEIIAEIGWNFMGDMELASSMIRSAKDCGADTTKFQYWYPAKLRSGPWDTDGRLEIYKEAALDANKIKELMQVCDDEGIGFLISAFNASDAAFLVDLGVDKLKIPSHEVANRKLHEFAAGNFQSVYVSLGAGSVEEVEEACNIYNSTPSLRWVGMHCVSSYPCSADNANLPRLNYLRSMCPSLGYSDHTSDLITPVVSVALGVSVIEKHFTVDKDLPGRDNKFALNPKELSVMVDNIRVAEAALQDHGSGPRDIEFDTMKNYRGRWGD